MDADLEPFDDAARRIAVAENARDHQPAPVWAPGVEGAVVLSARGGDFLCESGEDLSVSYADHDAEAVQLYIEESFSFRVATPEAAVAFP